jgi:hypothetical protein
VFPLRDDIPARTRPVVNVLLIAVTSLAFLGQLGAGLEDSTLVERLGMIPARITQPDQPVEIPARAIERTWRGARVVQTTRPAAPAAVPAVLTLLTCVFLHGGWLHFLGNMWFLWVFGDNVEDRLGHGGYLLFYLGAGVAASAAHLVANPASPIPTIGASGAVAGVMGAYLLLYPRARVLAAIPIFFFLHLMVVPAPLFLGVWFLLQLFQGVASVSGSVARGVAWWAHIGGFAAGAAVVWALARAGRLHGAVGRRRPGMDQWGRYRRKF